MKAEPSEDAPSPYTDISMMDDETSPTDKVCRIFLEFVYFYLGIFFKFDLIYLAEQ